tara:strand:+ start:1960 stop:2331 length:372 start_codon:yes stop_codon:yes gene_type:complete
MDRKYITRVTLGQPFFLSALFLFLLNELSPQLSKPIFIISYLNDFLAPSILLTSTALILSHIYNTIYILSKAQLFFFFVYLSFVFEILLPQFSKEYTPDKFDVILYALGTVMYHIFSLRNESR